jgi:hypothetical protein
VRHIYPGLKPRAQSFYPFGIELCQNPRYSAGDTEALGDADGTASVPGVVSGDAEAVGLGEGTSETGDADGTASVS